VFSPGSEIRTDRILAASLPVVNFLIATLSGRGNLAAAMIAPTTSLDKQSSARQVGLVNGGIHLSLARCGLFLRTGLRSFFQQTVTGTRFANG